MFQHGKRKWLSNDPTSSDVTILSVISIKFSKIQLKFLLVDLRSFNFDMIECGLLLLNNADDFVPVFWRHAAPECDADYALWRNGIQMVSLFIRNAAT